MYKLKSLIWCLFFIVFNVNSIQRKEIAAITTYELATKGMIKAASSGFNLTAIAKTTTIWATAYQVNVTLTNNTTQSSSYWTAQFTLPTGNTLSTHTTNGVFKSSGQTVTVTNTSSNGKIAPGGSTTFTMIINMPQSGVTTISNLQAAANGSITPPVQLTAPILNAITVASGANNYTVSWSAVSGATSYTLQQSTTSSFTNPTTVYQGTATSKAISGQANGTYYYRVSASNSTATSTYSNTQSATVNKTSTLSAPTLNSISVVSGANSYTVSWNAVSGATSYTLQQSTTSSFTNPTTVYQGTATSKAISGQANGTYYYRVNASNSTVTSAYSNVQSATVTKTPTPTPAGYENSVWAEDWTNNLDAPTFIQGLSKGINTINVFVGQLSFDSSGNPVINGYSSDTPGRPAGTGAFPNVAALTNFVTQCKAKGVTVKLSIGGAATTDFGMSWKRLTSSNISAYAQALVNLCKTTGADGIDFDDEYEVNSNAVLAGKLAAEFKRLAPNLQTSFCVFAGIDATSGPWHEIDTIFLQNAVTSSGASAIDRIYVMSYYDGVTLAQNEQFMLTWLTWLKQKYSFSASQISVGVDPNDPTTSPKNGSLTTWIQFAAKNGFSTAIWDQQGVSDFVTNNWGEVVNNIYNG